MRALVFYLRLLLVFGMPFGILMGLFDGLLLDRGLDVAVTKGVRDGLLFGSLMSLSLGYLHRSAVESLAPAAPEAAMRVRQHATVELPFPYDQAFDRCIGALERVPGRLRRKDRAAGSIRADTKSSWASWGEKIEVRLRECASGTHVEISSHPTFRATVVDYGKNLRNLNTVIGALA